MWGAGTNGQLRSTRFTASTFVAVSHVTVSAPTKVTVWPCTASATGSPGLTQLELVGLRRKKLLPNLSSSQGGPGPLKFLCPARRPASG
eukprot:1581731-Rhodomonas_salina.4